MEMTTEISQNIKGGVLQRLVPGNKCKRKGFILGFDSLGYLGVLLICVGLGLGGLVLYKSYQVLACKWEVKEIADAMGSYNMLTMDNTYPTDLTQLLDTDAIAANKSSDGLPHGPFLKESSRWQSTSTATNSQVGLLDPWGDAYQVEDNKIVGGSSSAFGPFTATFKSANDD